MTLSLPYSVTYVDSLNLLLKLSKAIKGENEIFIDLEADSLYHYRSKICLIQILVAEQSYLVDPLAIVDLSPLLDSLKTKKLIIHGADYDLRMLFQQYHFVPQQLFDTMLAAQLLGESGLGLAALVKYYTGNELSKQQQKEDWSQRPLPTDMLEYAAWDTAHLPKIYAAQTQSLQELGRLQWHRETCEALIHATTQPKVLDTKEAWRIHGAGRLHPRQLHVLRKLWQWRETEADIRDIPSFKVLHSEILVRMAQSIGLNGERGPLPKFPSRMPEHKVEALLDCYHHALAEPQTVWPKRIKPEPLRLPNPNPKLLAYLKESRDKIAKSLGLDPSLIATKSIVSAVAITGCKNELEVDRAAGWMAWQKGLLLEPWMDWLKVRNKIGTNSELNSAANSGFIDAGSNS